MTDRLDKTKEKTETKGSNLEIALSVVGLCLGAIISDVVMEKYFPGSNYMTPVMMASTLSGGAMGYFVHKLYRK